MLCQGIKLFHNKTFCFLSETWGPKRVRGVHPGAQYEETLGEGPAGRGHAGACRGCVRPLLSLNLNPCIFSLCLKVSYNFLARSLT